MQAVAASATVHPAIVTGREMYPQSHESYLVLKPGGAVDWIDDPEQATAFASMREAARMATRLPSGLRAFGLPRGLERLDA